jgi:hypothetical protein
MINIIVLENDDGKAVDVIISTTIHKLSFALEKVI